VWQRVTIGSRAAEVFAPPSPRFALLFLHSHGDETLADHPAFTDALRENGLACCCPRASRSWWTDKDLDGFNAERYLLDDVVPWMRQTWNCAIAAAGISMGGQGALRLGFKFADCFPVVAGVASAVDFHLRYDNPSFPELPQLYRSREASRQDTATLRVNSHAAPRHIWFACDPTDETWFPGNDRLHEKLIAIGVPHTADLVTSAGGHSWNYFSAMAAPMMAFVKRGLEQESRRLL